MDFFHQQYGYENMCINTFIYIPVVSYTHHIRLNLDAKGLPVFFRHPVRLQIDDPCP